MAEIGGFGLSVPEEYGGFAAGGESDYLAMCVATEELSWGSLGAGGALITRPEILTRAIVKGGTEEQKHAWLPADRDRRARRRRDGHRARLRLRRRRRQGHRDADRRRLPHQRREDLVHVRRPRRHARWCSPAPIPTAAVGHRGLSVFVVDKPPAPGHHFAFDDGRGGKMEGRAIDTLGYRGMHSYEVAFDNWFVPADNLDRARRRPRQGLLPPDGGVRERAAADRGARRRR